MSALTTPTSVTRRHVQPLRDHLRADEDVGLVREERREDAVVRVAAARRRRGPSAAAAHAGSARDLRLDLLDADAQQPQARRSALRARAGRRGARLHWWHSTQLAPS